MLYSRQSEAISSNIETTTLLQPNSVSRYPDSFPGGIRQFHTPQSASHRALPISFIFTYASLLSRSHAVPQDNNAPSAIPLLQPDQGLGSAAQIDSMHTHFQRAHILNVTADHKLALSVSQLQANLTRNFTRL